jgi:hypothetical protein
MALASYVLMFAGSPQTFIGYATAQDSLLLLFDILPAYVRHVRSQLEQRLMEFSSFVIGVVSCLAVLGFVAAVTGAGPALSIQINIVDA